MDSLPERAFLGILSESLSKTEIAARYGVSVKTIAKRLKADPGKPGRPVAKRVPAEAPEPGPVQRKRTERAEPVVAAGDAEPDFDPADWRTWVYGGCPRPR